MPSLFVDVAEDYLLYIQHERGLSTNTYYCYKSHLQQFAEWLTGQGFQEPTLEAVFTKEILRRYLYSLSGRGLRPCTIRSNFHAIRRLGLFCEANSILKESPAHTIRLPKKPGLRETLPPIIDKKTGQPLPEPNTGTPAGPLYAHEQLKAQRLQQRRGQGSGSVSPAASEALSSLFSLPKQ